MDDLFEYEIIEKGAVVRGWKGRVTDIEIPSMFHGIPVIKLGDYCFYNNRNILVVKIPDTVEELGTHCFYDCRNLRMVYLSDRIISLGDGVFKNCWEVQKIVLRKIVNKRTCLNNILMELSQKLKVESTYIKEGRTIYMSKVVFPEYALDYVDNVEARIINQVTYGSGICYRECMKDKDIDYRRYDQTFQIAKVNDEMETLFEIAKDRICYPYELTDESKKIYVQYLKGNLEKIAAFVVEKNERDDLNFLIHYGFFTENNIDTIIEMAYRMNQVESISALLDYKNKKLKKRRKSFDL